MAGEFSLLKEANHTADFHEEIYRPHRIINWAQHRKSDLRMGPIVDQHSQLTSWLDYRPERDHLWVEAGERDPGHLPKRDHLLVGAAEKDLDHSPKHDHLLVGAVERDLDRSPKL